MQAEDIFNMTVNSNEEQKETLEDKLAKERANWLNVIEEMSKKMKNIGLVSELMLMVYTERQRCAEYHTYILSKLAAINKEYRKQYDKRYSYWSFESQIRYPNNNALNNKILTELAPIIDKRELLDNHAKYIQNTLTTIDNIIYGISKRVDIEKIMTGR